MIPCRGPNAFRNLLLALRETQNNEAEAILSSLKYLHSFKITDLLFHRRFLYVLFLFLEYLI